MYKLTQLTLALALLALTAVPAGAQNLDLDEMAAALALPILTGGHGPNLIKNSTGDVVIPGPTAITLATVTNGKSTPVLLRVDAISGDPTNPGFGGDTWQSDSFDCLLTGRETTTFLFLPAPQIDGSFVYVECSTPFGTDGPLADNKVLGLRTANGIAYMAVADPNTGKVISEDVVFGDAVVIDTAAAQAYSFGAIPFQAGNGANDGNKVYRFDGNEYAKFPAALATNFIAPAANRINAELILFTLDGTTGNPTVPRVALAGLGYDDDETPFDFQWEFDCFDVVSLTDMSINFAQVFLGSLSGHLQLVPQAVGAGGFDVHDAAYGDANNSRRRPVHGWIVQNVMPGESMVYSGQPHAGHDSTMPPMGSSAAAWGRPLAQGRGSLVPFLADQSPVLDAGPF